MSEVRKELILAGDGKNFPKPGDEVTMEYVGKLTNGNIFDETTNRGPFTTRIGMGKVIRGWDMKVPEMSLGEKAIITIPGEYAYGDRGFPNLIPPHATLIFDLQLVKINGKDKDMFAKEAKDTPAGGSAGQAPGAAVTK